MAPHLAGTGCFEKGTPTLTSFSVKIAEVCTDVTGGLQAYHIHPRVGCGVSWGRLEQHRQRSHSFPSTERTRGQTPLTVQFPLYPTRWANAVDSGLAQALASSRLPQGVAWSPPCCLVVALLSPLGWPLQHKRYLPILPFCREVVSPGAPSGLPPQERCRGSRGFCLQR